jgi:tetratricopeptide (TPR) repeat protein
VGPDGVKALSFTPNRDLLTDLANIGNTLKESSLRSHYLAKRDELLAQERRGGLSAADKVNLSEYLIRLGDYEKAVELLEPLAAQERSNFMVAANLATAHQFAGRLDRALRYLEQVSDMWPDEWPGWSKEQLAWYRRAEKFHLRLVRLRYRESLGGRGQTAEHLDDMFGDDKGPVRFVGDKGKYEAGNIAAAEKARLPADAVAVVQQLLVWLPQDRRLLWQLGELYNASDDVSAAAQYFESLVWTYRYDAPELKEHRQIVKAALPEPEPVSPGPVKATPAPDTEKSAPLPDTSRFVVIGAIAAVLIAGLIYLQVREGRRRRRSLG